MKNGWLQCVQNTLVAPRCVVCGGDTHAAQDVCPACDYDLPRITHACVQCGLPIEGATDLRCGQCVASPPAFAATMSAFAYAGPIRHLLHELKFRHKLHAARVLGELMVRELNSRDARVDLILPVPLHAARLRERGYNQALELARPIARALNIPIDLHSCERTRATAPQSDLPSEQRSRNVKNAFVLVRELKARRIALVDDVMTTGATVESLAALLRKSGVEEVQVWVCARALIGAN